MRVCLGLCKRDELNILNFCSIEVISRVGDKSDSMPPTATKLTADLPPIGLGRQDIPRMMALPVAVKARRRDVWFFVRATIAGGQQMFRGEL